MRTILWIIVGILVLLIIWAVVSWNRMGNQTNIEQNQNQEQTVEDLEGQSVQIDSITISQVINDQMFWIGEGEERIFVRRALEPNTNLPSADESGIRQGQVVSVKGIIKKLDLVVARNEWNLDPQTIANLEGLEFYIEATEIKVAEGSK